jgi:hypothetical protein
MWRVSCHPSWPGNLLSLVFWPSRFFLFWQALQLDMNWQHIERTDLVQHSCMHQMHIPLIDNSVIAAGQHYCSIFVPVIYMFSRKDPLLRIGRNCSHTCCCWRVAATIWRLQFDSGKTGGCGLISVGQDFLHPLQQVHFHSSAHQNSRHHIYSISVQTI